MEPLDIIDCVSSRFGQTPDPTGEGSLFLTDGPGVMPPKIPDVVR